MATPQKSHQTKNTGTVKVSNVEDQRVGMSLDRIPDKVFDKSSSYSERVPISSRNSFFASNAEPDGQIAHEDFLYKLASEDKGAFEFFSKNHIPTSRSPYEAGVMMCRGAAYFPKFKEYIEKGGIARYKNSVVASIRVNAIHSFDEMNGSFAGTSVLCVFSYIHFCND
jgi:hypothetical protein